jgi:transcriptional regulator with XRE-family HTH domain
MTILNPLRWDGEKLKILRQRQHLTQTELGEKIGTSQGAVCQWERGMMPSISRIQQIADVLGVAFESLYG